MGTDEDLEAEMAQEEAKEVASPKGILELLLEGVDSKDHPTVIRMYQSYIASETDSLPAMVALYHSLSTVRIIREIAFLRKDISNKATSVKIELEKEQVQDISSNIATVFPQSKNIADLATKLENFMNGVPVVEDRAGGTQTGLLITILAFLFLSNGVLFFLLWKAGIFSSAL